MQHDGIDTDLVAPKPDAALELDNGAKLTRDDEVVTFINRNLEPYRGYHIFMRALPELLKKRPNAQVVMLGGDETSYGARPPRAKHGSRFLLMRCAIKFRIRIGSGSIT